MYFRKGTTDDWRQHLSARAQALVAEAARHHWAGLEDHPLIGPYLSAMDAETSLLGSR